MNLHKSVVPKEKIKPFLKWAGGKQQLLAEIQKFYPFENSSIDKYVEPFLGGGAVLFDILSKYNLKHVYVSDINLELIDTYITIRDNIEELIGYLLSYQEEFLVLDNESRKNYYLAKREQFNNLKKLNNNRLEKASLMIFLNKTCFNGLFRVNKSGLFNVPMGVYKNPLICDINNLKIASKLLQNVEIAHAKYSESIKYINENTFVYFDPPYRPIKNTSSFTSYTENAFNDSEQIELAKFINRASAMGAKILLSNSDPKNYNKDDNFFDDLYENYNIHRVKANRMINSKSSARGKITELLISNY